MEECGHKGLNCYEAGREIESLRQQLAAMTQERNEMERQRDDNWRNATENLLRLAASQAYAAQLREALDEIANKEFLGNLAPAQDIAAKAPAIPANELRNKP
jgi:hypothetical protein